MTRGLPVSVQRILILLNKISAQVIHLSKGPLHTVKQTIEIIQLRRILRRNQDKENGKKERHPSRLSKVPSEGKGPRADDGFFTSIDKLDFLSIDFSVLRQNRFPVDGFPSSIGKPLSCR
jgi:hypothetical protein